MASYSIVLAFAAMSMAAVSPSSAQIPTSPPAPGAPISDISLFQLALNLEYLEAEFYLFSAYGVGLDKFAPSLTGGGPSPIGGKRAFLSPDVLEVAKMLALQEIGHIRIIREFLGNKCIARPLIDIGKSWGVLFKAAEGGKDVDVFDPYANDHNWLLAAYALPYVGLTAYVGSNPHLKTTEAKELLGGVLGVEGGQDSLLRTILWTKRNHHVLPYYQSVAEITQLISGLRNRLDGSNVIDDEGIVVKASFGAEGKISTNILSANKDSLSYARNPAQTISIVYGTGSPSKAGGFWPKGANGLIPQYYLKHPSNAIGQPLK